MTAATPPQFQFTPAISLDEYRKLWQTELETTQEKLRALERPRSDKEVSAYLDDINDFDMLTRRSDIRGVVWKAMHPDAAFRDEAEKAKQAFTALSSQVVSSSAIADNLSKYEKAAMPFENDTKRLLEEWKRDLRKGGAYLDSEGKERVKQLTVAIQAAMDEYEDNVRNDTRHLEFDAEQLKGVPDDYLVSHPVDPTTGKIHIASKNADVIPLMEYCQVQATREKVFRFRQTKASPTNEAVLKRLLDLRFTKANLLGYKDWADYQLDNTMAKTTEAVLNFLEEAHDAVKGRAEREKAQIVHLLKEQEGVEAQPWDLSYGTTLLKTHLLPGFDPKDARQYFPVDRSFSALKKLAQNLFGLRFEDLEETRGWLPSVSSCLVYDPSCHQETLLGRLFFDIYPRDGKVDGAEAWTV
jgi:thimet oligopeptidase